MLIEFDSYSIAQHWVCAIENGDYSGLSDSEEKELNAFLESIPFGCWQWSDDVVIAKDQITGLLSDCLEGVLYVESSTI